MAQEATVRHREPGRLVTFLGYEWGNWRCNGGADGNDYYLQDLRLMFQSDDGHRPNPATLFEAIRDETAIVIFLHPVSNGNHCDYKDHHSEKERLISFEWVDDQPLEDTALSPAKFWDTPFRFCYVLVTQQEGDMAWASPIWVS